MTPEALKKAIENLVRASYTEGKFEDSAVKKTLDFRLEDHLKEIGL